MRGHDAEDAREREEAEERRRRAEEGRDPNNDYPEPAITIIASRRWGGNHHRGGETQGGKGRRIRGQLEEAGQERLDGATRYRERQDRNRQKKENGDIGETIAPTGTTMGETIDGAKTASPKTRTKYVQDTEYARQKIAPGHFEVGVVIFRF